jgi:hypothetical protein
MQSIQQGLYSCLTRCHTWVAIYWAKVFVLAIGQTPDQVTSENKGNCADYEDAGGQHQDFGGIKSRKILAFILSCSVANRLGVGAIDPMGTR